jgi:hypothetical protein
MRYSIIWSIVSVIAFVTFAGATTIPTADRVAPLIVGDGVSAGSGIHGVCPASSPGDTMGWTYYDYQHSGSTGRQIVHVSEGDFIFSWMCATDVALANRHIYYNYWKADSGFRWPGNPTPGGIQVDQQLKSGYTTCDVLSDGRAVVAFHERVDANPNAYYTVVAVELASGLGVFDVTAVDTFTWAPTNIDSCPIWPKVAVDIYDNIHVLTMNNGFPESMGVFYSRSTDGGWTWEPWFTLDTTLRDLSYVVQTSRSTGKVGIAYTAYREGMDPEYISQMSNDVYYWESQDGGATWPLQKQNITQWAEDDSLRCYTDCDLIYDNNDDPHFVFMVYKAEGDSAFYPYYSMILHSDIEGYKSRVSGWGWPPDSMNGWWFSSYDPGAWRFPADRPSLGVDDSNSLHCIWVGCKDEDMSAGGFHNGDIYASASGSGYGPGGVWGCDHEPDSVWNLTNSETPGGIPGECDDDDYPSLAEEVYDNTLHIFYVNDKDAGGIPQEEGTATDCPVIYLRHVAPRMDGIAEHADEPGLPQAMLGVMVYPNPLHSECMMRYHLPHPSRVQVAVYDVCGRLVSVLFDGDVAAGIHHTAWDGRDGVGSRVGAGIYFCRLVAGSGSVSQKIVVAR